MSAMLKAADRQAGCREQICFLGQESIRPRQGRLYFQTAPILGTRAIDTLRNKPLLKDYLIGTDWDGNRPAREQAGKTILDKLAKDTLPGIKPADVAALTAAHKAYQAVEGEQAGEQTDLRSERDTLSDLIEKIKTARKEVQLAADSEWPASDKANAGTRQEFRLPLNRSLRA